MQKDNFIGKKFGRLTVLEIVPKDKRIGGKDAIKRTQYLCQCDCGNKSIVTQLNLVRGRTRSCGCIRIAKVLIHGYAKREQDGRHPRLFRIWHGMKGRCYHKSNASYKYYGALGVTICNEWLHDFKAFFEWSMSHGYNDKLTIDRIDPNKNYCPDNCRWVTYKQQNEPAHKRKLNIK